MKFNFLILAFGTPPPDYTYIQTPSFYRGKWPSMVMPDSQWYPEKICLIKNYQF